MCVRNGIECMFIISIIANLHLNHKVKISTPVTVKNMLGI